MITKLSPSSELEQLFIEALINKTSGKVNKVSPNSVLSGVAAGVSKIAQKTLKEVALIESVNFPDSASGLMLDTLADKLGVPGRYTATNSSTYVRIVAVPGTFYDSLIVQLRTNNGIIFNLQNNVTIPDIGYTYAAVSSTTQGSETNVLAGAINQVSSAPTGHIYVVNEYAAQGGRDIEEDFLFRRRIKEGPNILATGTLAALEQAFNKINNRVIRVFYYGLNNVAKPVLGIASCNGEDFSQNELDELLEQGEKFFSVSDLRPFGQPKSYGIELVNVTYQTIDVSFRVDILQNVDIDQIRIDIQTRFSKLYDYRNWTYDRKVEWDDLLQVVKNTRGVRYVPDQFFNPRFDIKIENGKLPRFRSMVISDLSGNVISDNQGFINPIFYSFPVEVDFQNTVLRDL